MTPRSRVVRWLLGSILALAATLLVFETTSWDLALQDHFYDPDRAEWMIDRDEPYARWLFYRGPKYVIVLLGLGLIVLGCGRARWRQRCGFARRDLWLAILTLATVPALIGQLKDVTNVHCPRHIRRYGGDVPYVRVFERYPADDRPARPGKCFPAGHASGGFALIGLFWLHRSRAWRAGTIIATLLTGWAMGGYQMLSGSHYLSHTLTTMLLAVILTLTWRLVLAERPEAAGTLAARGS